MSNINSFSDNMSDLTKSCDEIIKIAEGMNEAIYGNDSEIVISENLTLPSFSNVVNRLERAEKTVANITSGGGTIETADGTFRKIKASPISEPPDRIEELGTVTEFDIDSNWFFESLQYPKCIVNIDLTGKIEPTADRVYINRVILDSEGLYSDGQYLIRTFYEENIYGKNLKYTELIELLEKYKIEYREDKQEAALPLTFEKYNGSFKVTGTRLIKDDNRRSRLWYFLDTVEYDMVDFDGIVKESGFVLKSGDMLRFEGTLYKITDMNATSNCVRLEPAVGYSTISTGDVVELYNDPFSEKIAKIGIGINEIDIIYFRSVNENFNMMSREWSDPVEFYSNNLVFSNDVNETMLSYYIKNVSDFGKTWISQAKEKMISAYEGKTPFAPSLNPDDLKVVQINTQLDSTFDREKYNNLISEIANLKSGIESLRYGIESNKDILTKTNGKVDRNDLENKISADTNKLSSEMMQYSSLMDEMNTLLTDAGVINYTPKYRVRGFFTIPESRYADENNKHGEEKIIAFDVMYRYLHTDNTGVTLETYGYTNGDGVVETGVFTDWNITKTETLSKEYDTTSGTYEWVSQNTADGSEININQIDIPIRKGEKVEIKVRSISEAGYPYNPLKSEWSNSIIVSFPDNLTDNDPISVVVNSMKNDTTVLKIQQTMSSSGVYAHMNDTNNMYKHSSKNISYLSVNDAENTETEVSLQNKISSMDDNIADILIKHETLNKNYESIIEKYNILDGSVSTCIADISNINETIENNDERYNRVVKTMAPIMESAIKSIDDYAKTLDSSDYGFSPGGINFLKGCVINYLKVICNALLDATK